MIFGWKISILILPLDWKPMCVHDWVCWFFFSFFFELMYLSFTKRLIYIRTNFSLVFLSTQSSISIQRIEPHLTLQRFHFTHEIMAYLVSTADQLPEVDWIYEKSQALLNLRVPEMIGKLRSHFFFLISKFNNQKRTWCRKFIPNVNFSVNY